MRSYFKALDSEAIITFLSSHVMDNIFLHKSDNITATVIPNGLRKVNNFSYRVKNPLTKVFH